MDEPGWAWPAWKFGLRKDDLFGSLHDKYNTFTSTIQDPEAFHHDVYEISNLADSADEFHRLLAVRQAQRLRELNESLESAAIEIIANPRLIGTEQWQYALQLFRTKSLDSLVRYFASYIPEDHFQRRCYDSPPSSGSSFAETCSVATASTKPSTIDDLDIPRFFTDGEDKPVFTHEPLDIINASSSSHSPAAKLPQLPPSPRSMTMRSDASSSCSLADDDIEHHDFAINAGTPARTLSFSGSESDRFAPAERGGHHTDDEEALETSQSDFDTPVTSESDLAESQSSLESVAVSDMEAPLPDVDDEFPPAQLPMDFLDGLESETPTPRQELPSSSYLDSVALRAHRATSPKSPRLRRREVSPLHGAARRSPEECLSRIQKPLPDPMRTRPKGRRRVD